MTKRLGEFVAGLGPQKIEMAFGSDALSVLKSSIEMIEARETDHGDKAKMFDDLARLWSAYLPSLGVGVREPLTASQVSIMLSLMKVARTSNGDFNLDDFIDGAAYVAIAAEVAV